MPLAKAKLGPSRTRPKAEERETSSVMLRAMSVISAVAENEGTLSVAEIAAKIGLPKPTVHRMCQQLEAAGYLLRDIDSRHYGVGHRLWHLGLEVVNAGMKPERRAILQKLVNEIGETCNLSMRIHDQSIYIDRVESRWPLRMHLEPGSMVPLHCTASGKLFLSDMNRARRQKLLSVTQLPTHTPRTITDLDAMEREIELIRKRGYSIDDEEFLEGLVALAVPVRNKQGRVVAGIACHGPTARLTLDQILSFLPSLRNAAADLEDTLPTDDADKDDV
ncbi:IclR family transcriptional regulator [Candidatus Filomicrobium marinum]|nr:IclR family transcriptional regulator [Candidatus Filomicrobium marinum]